jgi:hypothetical protein
MAEPVRKYPYQIPFTDPPVFITYGEEHSGPGGDRFEVAPGIWISPSQLQPVTSTGGVDVDAAVGGEVGAGAGSVVNVTVTQDATTGLFNVVNAQTGEVISGGHATVLDANQMAGILQGGGGSGGAVAPAQASVQAAMEAAGIPWDVSFPQQQFSQYAGQQFRPGLNYLRSAFYGMQEPLMQQYYLGAPQMEQPFGGFGQFMAQRGADAAQSPYAYTPQYPTKGFTPSLGGLAQRAAATAGLTPGQFLQYIDPQAGYAGPDITEQTRGFLGDLTPAQQLWYRRVYGTSEKSEENRAALVNLMALQRSPVGGAAQPMYGGALGEAITGSLGELYTQLMARDPGANFLDWYMQRTAGQPGIGGFLTPKSPPVPPSSVRGGPPIGGPFIPGGGFSEA